MPALANLTWDNAFARLPAAFHQRIDPTPVPDPRPVAWNESLAAKLGWPGDLAGDDTLAVLAGNRVLDGMEPIASGYAGHQFGSWVPELGDGRAIILGELVTAAGDRREIQLKGAGLTRFSRMGDGRAVLRSTIREYLGSAAMTGLGIPTTEALAIVASPLPVHRERTETAAILTRVAETHIRFGTFEYLAARRLAAERKLLADFVIERIFPTLLVLPETERYGAWYGEVVERTARLMAMWIAAGFAHGVMNTDNFSITGLTIDYGPYGWMDGYDPGLICNHSDWAGRYAFDQQPAVGLWNCARLGEALHPLVDEPTALAALEGYRGAYEDEAATRMRAKLGLVAVEDDDVALATALLELMRGHAADYARTFRALSHWDGDDAGTLPLMVAEIGDSAALAPWLERYAARLAREPRGAAARHEAMLATNPKFVLRNWVAQDVIQNAETRNVALVDEVRRVLEEPFAEHPAMERYAAKPPAWAKEIVVSCSS
jgi:uncharacterized protein YdiU (UPF0061 family)